MYTHGGIETTIPGLSSYQEHLLKKCWIDPLIYDQLSTMDIVNNDILGKGQIEPELW